MDWNAIAAPWLRVEAETDAAHAPIVEGLIKRAGLQVGQSVLDIGPGGGVSLLAAAQAVGSTGHVTGIEIAPPFAERAQSRVPENVSVHVGDATDYPFVGRSYDAAISMLGVMFFAEPERAFAHIRGALKPGAVFCFAAWGAPEANTWFDAPAQVADDVFGPGPALNLDAPGPLSLSDAGKITRLLTSAGWSVAIDTQDLILTPRGSPEDVAALYVTIGAAAMRMGVAKAKGTLTQEHRDALRAGLIALFTQMTEGDRVCIPAQVHYVRAIA